MNRSPGILVLLAVASSTWAPVFGQSRTENVVLVTADGIRHQELFGGLDRAILLDGPRGGVEDREALEKAFWRETAEERREALMPFFWQELAPRGIVLGDRTSGSPAAVTNGYRVSFPGYAELLGGRPIAEITGNIAVQNPRETVLEFVRRELSLDRRAVAAFTSWDHFPYIVQHEPGAITVNAGGSLPTDLENEEMRRIADLEERTLSPWSTVRQNVFTEALALAYLEEHRPRLLYLAYDETDEWAHARRYDRTLGAIRKFDDSLKRLWQKLQSISTYRDRTTLIITTDHGRGRGPADWTSHGSEVPGAAEIWIAIIGPDTPARGIVTGAGPVFQSQIAATIIKCFGLDPGRYHPDARPPLEIAFQ